MRPLQQILCPVDFSEFSRMGLRYAGAFARCSGARITALFADSFLPPVYFTQSRVEELEKEFRHSRREALNYLRQFVSEALAPEGMEAEAKVAVSLPVEAVLQEARELPADMIIMGTHGRSGINRLMMGSVTEQVLRASSVPVLAVRGKRDFALQKILCPVNDTAAARAAMEFSLRLAHCFGSTVTLLHVREAGAKDTIANLCAWMTEEQRAACEIRMIGGGVAEGVIATAEELRADMLVLGARHRRFFDSTVIGANTARMVRHAPCPVLTVVEQNG